MVLQFRDLPFQILSVSLGLVTCLIHLTELLRQNGKIRSHSFDFFLSARHYGILFKIFLAQLLSDGVDPLGAGTEAILPSTKLGAPFLGLVLFSDACLELTEWVGRIGASI